MELFDFEYFSFVSNHLNEDVAKLRLKFNEKINKELLSSLCTQIEGRRKFKNKFPNLLANEKFIIPTISIGEQASSEVIAEFHALLIGKTESLLDMTCGMGVDAFAFSMEATKVTAIEIDSSASAVATHNTSVIGIKNVEVINADSVEWLANSKDYFSSIFIDPMRRDDKKRFYALSDCKPDVTSMISLFKNHTSKVFIKASPMFDISSAITQLSNVSAVYVISVQSECKEILIEMDFEKEDNIDAKIVAINIKKENCEVVSTNFSSLHSNFDTIKLVDVRKIEEAINSGCGYIYEPNASIMKAGIWGKLESIYKNLSPLSSNTHLFFSSDCIIDFPGRCFKLLTTVDKKREKRLKKEKRNIIVRNFPLSANELGNKLGIKDGGDKFIIGCKVGTQEKPVIYDAERI